MELTSQAKKGSRSPVLRVPILNGNPLSNCGEGQCTDDAALVEHTRRTHRCNLERGETCRRMPVFPKVVLRLGHSAAFRLLTDQLAMVGVSSTRVVTPHLDLTLGSSPQAVANPRVDPGTLHGNQHHVPQCIGRLGHDSHPPSYRRRELTAEALSPRAQLLRSHARCCHRGRSGSRRTSDIHDLCERRREPR